jgi:hypothetical protein
MVIYAGYILVRLGKELEQIVEYQSLRISKQNNPAAAAVGH